MASDEARVLVLYTGGTIGMLKTKEGGYAPHSGFLASNLRSQSRFHDPEQDSVFANSQSVSAYSAWSLNAASKASSGTSTPAIPLPVEGDASCITVQTPEGARLLPSLVTPRTAQGKRIRYAIYEYETLIDSSEVELNDWIRIANDIELNYKLYDAFVVLHGTDTMAYSASALSFLLEDLGKPVILTGAQIPLSELFTDAIDNLLGSLIIAGHYAIPEVCVFFDNKLLRGNRSIKASSEEFHAFQSPNLPPLAAVGIDIDVEWNEVLRPGLRAFRAHKTLSSKVATLRIFPGISGSAIRAFLNADDVRGVVLESYGAGNAPRREELLSAFREATERGVVIVNVSQCTTGAVAPDIYETGRALAAVGITGGADMTVECALAKLSYLLSKEDLSPAQVRRLLAQPLRGELTLVNPAPTYSSPLDAGQRLRTLFAQVIECAPTTSRGPHTPAQRPRSLSSVTGSDMPSQPDPVELPAEFNPPWPATLKDEETAEKAILPYLLGQASARHDTFLDTLLASIVPPTATNDPTVIALLNEPSTPSLQTPLHLAVLAGQASNVELLLSHGASVHARDILGHSALFYAAKSGAEGRRMVMALKQAGAHLGETELEGGDVGLELLKARRSGDSEAEAVWREAAGAALSRAVESVKLLYEA
ncbi:asparaginase-domain-containing protein [Leucosporidium creatinivorum]|uniref:asparaginase n=1 Tax=Leucosporidium creatinivorum TaxID=106004 RepID=A0A1Y2ERZ6_9BASI|nr:asparaginase-domain-containing protein [Leucosporidium creatinivorum]